jgi:hypothetical protein
MGRRRRCREVQFFRTVSLFLRGSCVGGRRCRGARQTVFVHFLRNNPRIRIAVVLKKFRISLRVAAIQEISCPQFVRRRIEDHVKPLANKRGLCFSFLRSRTRRRVDPLSEVQMAALFDRLLFSDRRETFLHQYRSPMDETTFRSSSIRSPPAVSAFPLLSTRRSR